MGQRRATALGLLLLAHSVTPMTATGEIVAPSSDWAGAIDGADPPGRRAAISRSWDWLEAQRFVITRPAGGLRSVRVLREDGSGLPWRHPYDTDEPYFKLPNLVWTSGLWADLELPAKAAFLIALSLQQPPNTRSFVLPIDRGAAWYGLGARTLRAGLRQLSEAGLIRHWSEKRKTENSDIGYAYTRRYALNTHNLSRWNHAQN